MKNEKIPDRSMLHEIWEGGTGFGIGSGALLGF
jgi:hypothetical protein